MADSRLHIETLLMHGAYAPEEDSGATTPAIVQSTSFAYRTPEELEAVFSGRHPGYIYSRITNPTVSSLERRLAHLEEGVGAVATASGMAAISTTVLALAGSGDNIVSGSSIFGGTYSLFEHTLRPYGIQTNFVDATDVEAYRRAVTDRTRLIFVETIGNPKLDVPNLAAIGRVARESGVAFVVDNTTTTPVLTQPKAMGADIIIHSLSKFINGHGNAIGGMIIDCGTVDWSNPRYQHLRSWYDRAGSLAFLAFLRSRVYRDLGCCLAPFNAFLSSIGIESLAVRMERHCSNSAAVAAVLQADARVAHLRYPGLPEHPDYDTVRRQFQGRGGALLTLRLGTKKRCFDFIRALKRAQNLANLGDAKTLVIHPASTICRDATEKERAAMGVSDDLVRFSIGIEHVDDILNDIDEALKSAQ